MSFVTCKFLLVYLNDILLSLRQTYTAAAEHVQHLHLVLQLLLEKILFIEAEKGDFYTSSNDFLGFLVGQVQLSPHPAKVSAVADVPLTFLANSSNSSWGLQISIEASFVIIAKSMLLSPS